MILAPHLCRYASAVGLFFAASLYADSAAAQAPTMKVLTFGGSDQETLAGFAIDHAGNYYIAGTTASLDLPVNVLQKHPGGASLYRFRADRVDPLYPQPAVVSAIASDPSRPGVLYASFGHAIWRSPDSGDTWQRLSADWPIAAECTGIAVAPKDSRTIYVLCPSSLYPQYTQQQLFRSTDAGATWVRARLQVQTYFAPLLSVTVDPFNPQSVWAVGVTVGQFAFLLGFHSADGGDTWTHIDQDLLQFAFDDRRAGIAYAFALDGLYRTTDSGQSWTKLATPSELAQQDYSGTSIAILPSGDALFVRGHLLARTHDNGSTWQTSPLPGNGMPCESLSNGRDPALRADPVSGSVYLQICGYPRSFILRSDDVGATWRQVNPVGLPYLNGQAISPTSLGFDYFAIVRKSTDAFVAKLSPSGDIMWSTFLGGVHDETATGLALDPDNNVYVIGTTLSDDFTFTRAPFAKALPAPTITPKSFIAKLSPDGTQLLYSVLYAYDATARGIATDSSGAVYITGSAGASLPTTPGVIRPEAIGSAPTPFVLKLDPSGSGVVYGTYLPEMPALANAIAVDSDDNAYVGGSSIWKLNPDATALVLSTKLPSGTVSAIAVDAERNLYVGGAATTLTFPTTPGAFQTQLLPTICGIVWSLGSNLGVGYGSCWATPAFITKFNPDANLMLYSTYLGGDGWDAVRSLAITSDGTAYATGYTISRSFPTRLPIQGPLLPLFGQNGFVSGLVPDGSDLAMSTYLSDGRDLQAVAVALDPAGNPVVAGHNLGAAGGSNDVPTPASDVLIFRLEYSGTTNTPPRLDSILNAASRTGTPLAPGQRVALQGAGFQADSQVCFNDACVSPVAVADNEILAEPPASIPDKGSITVSVQSSDGSRSNRVMMPIGPARLALYSTDNSGAGQVRALNENGTLNSSSNPAPRGTAVIIPANGLDPSAQTLLGGLINASVSTGTFPGLPGQLPLIRATVDPNLQSSIANLQMLGYTFPGHMPVTLSIAPAQSGQ